MRNFNDPNVSDPITVFFWLATMVLAIVVVSLITEWLTFIPTVCAYCLLYIVIYIQEMCMLFKPAASYSTIDIPTILEDLHMPPDDAPYIYPPFPVYPAREVRKSIQFILARKKYTGHTMQHVVSYICGYQKENDRMVALYDTFHPHEWCVYRDVVDEEYLKSCNDYRIQQIFVLACTYGSIHVIQYIDRMYRQNYSYFWELSMLTGHVIVERNTVQISKYLHISSQLYDNGFGNMIGDGLTYKPSHVLDNDFLTDTTNSITALKNAFISGDISTVKSIYINWVHEFGAVCQYIYTEALVRNMVELAEWIYMRKGDAVLYTDFTYIMMTHGYTHDAFEMVYFLCHTVHVDPSTDDNQAFVFACANRQLDIAQFLLTDPRVDPTAQDNTSLLGAATYDHGDIVRLICEDPRVDLSAKYKALCFARHSGAEVSEYLQQFDYPAQMLQSIYTKPVSTQYVPAQSQKDDVHMQRTCSVHAAYT